jgi:hypothetical protein
MKTILLLIGIFVVYVIAGIYPVSKNEKGITMCWSTLDDNQELFECPEYDEPETFDWDAIAAEKHRMDLGMASAGGATAEQLERWKSCDTKHMEEIVEGSDRLACQMELAHFLSNILAKLGH